MYLRVIHCCSCKSLFFILGLWDAWQGDPSHSLRACCIIAICVTNMLIATLGRVLVDEDHQFADIHIATDWTRLPTRVASYVGPRSH